MSVDCSSIWLELSGPGRKKLLCGQLYREHQYQNSPDNVSKSEAAQFERWEKMIDQWRRSQSVKIDTIVLGDVNIDYLKWSSPKYFQRRLIDRIEEEIIPLGFTQCVTRYTRSWTGLEHSLLDQIWSNCTDRHGVAEVSDRSSSDHNLVFTDYWGLEKEKSVKYIVKRSMKNFSPANFTEELKKLDWTPVVQCKNPSLAVGILTETLNGLLDTMAQTQMKKNYAQWLSVETLTEMDERDRRRRTAEITGTFNSWEEYRSHRNLCLKLNKQDRKNWTKGKIEACEKEKDGKKLWT